jgi:RHS repeat-associated protein
MPPMTPRTHILTFTMLVSLWFGLAGPAFGYYDPAIQRWINRDPINEPGFTLLTCTTRVFNRDEEKHLYGFVMNEPISHVDPRGLFLGFSYGNWCGFSNSGQKGRPIDDLDALCMVHDYCLATWSAALENWKICNFTFCSAVSGVDCKKSPKPSECRSARSKILCLCLILSPTFQLY